MGKGRSLTCDERTSISSYKECGLSNREIAKKINRSATVIDNYLKNSENYGKNYKSGGNSKLSTRQKSHILLSAARGKVNAAEIVDNLCLPVTSRRVQQILKGSQMFHWEKRQKKPALSKGHKVARLAFARKHMDWKEKWAKVIFSDEKKFNLDGPDGAQYYWHDLRKVPEISMSRNFGGGSLMTWAAFSFNGKASLRFISTKSNSEDYTKLLEDVLCNFGHQFHQNGYIFQHDNAPIHRSRHTIQWFKSNNIEVMDWPARSPDLNPMENLWGILSRAVYKNGKQFSSINELKSEILLEWLNIPKKTLQNLVSSMEQRIFELILKAGGATKY